MWVYYFLFLSLICISFKDFISISETIKYIIGQILLIVLICFFGFRYNCDQDYSTYVEIYKGAPSLTEGLSAVFGYSVLVGVESGFIMVNALFKMLSFGTQSIFIFSAILTFVLVYRVFRKYSFYPTISLLLYCSQFFTLPFTQMRFGIAMAFVLLACFYLHRGKKARYWGLILLGTTFHLCALGGAVVFFFYQVNWLNRKTLLWSVLLFSFLSMFLPMRNLLVTLMNSVGAGRYSAIYADTETASPVSTILSLVILTPFIHYHKGLEEKGVPVNILLAMGLSSVVVGCGVWQLGILNRFSMITAVSFCIIIPSYLLLFKMRREVFFGFVLIIMYAFLKFLPHIKYLTDYQLFFNQIF